MRFGGTVIALTCLFAASAMAQDLTVKSVSCASGTLNPSGTLEVGKTFGLEEIKKVPATVGSVVEAGIDVVFTAQVGGGDNDGGACYNHGVPTIVIITLSKNK